MVFFNYIFIMVLLKGAFGTGKSRTEAIGNSISFAMGLATTLALLGVGASFAGKAYGQIGQGLPIAASALAIVMGLNLLEVRKSWQHFPIGQLGFI